MEAPGGVKGELRARKRSSVPGWGGGGGGGGEWCARDRRAEGQAGGRMQAASTREPGRPAMRGGWVDVASSAGEEREGKCEQSNVLTQWQTAKKSS